MSPFHCPRTFFYVCQPHTYFFLFKKGKGLIERGLSKTWIPKGGVLAKRVYYRVYMYLLYGKILVIPLQFVTDLLHYYFKTSKYGISKLPGGDREFSLVMDKVLLPLALEKHLKSRSLEVSNTACQWARKYDGESAQELQNDDVEAVAGDDDEMKQTFLHAYGSDDGRTSLPDDCTDGHRQSYSKIKHAINQINIKREQNLVLLFDYVKDQGWTKGSAIGSADHEMNRNGNGLPTLSSC